MPDVTVTDVDREAAAKASGFSSYEEAQYWSRLAKQNAVMDLAHDFARHRIAALDRAAEVAEEFAAVVDGMPRHEQPLLENSEGWRRVSDGAKDIADAILALKEPT